MAPKNSLLDFAGDFAEPQFGSFRFVAVKLNLTFQLRDPSLQLRHPFLSGPKLIRHSLSDLDGIPAVSSSQIGSSPQQGQNVFTSDVS
jgi:hypothetical protein